MLPYKTLIVIDKTSSVAFYKQIAAQFINLIQKGLIQSGIFIPSSREMAVILEIHRNTVIAAYEELAAQNWIETVPRKGTRVSINLPIIKPRSFSEDKDNPEPYSVLAHFSFSKEYIKLIPNRQLSETALLVNDGFPDIDLAPMDYIIKEYRRQLNGNNMKKSAVAANAGGSPLFKSATCKFLNETRGLSISDDNILITRGAQMAIYLAASLLIKPGDLVMVSDPSYFIANAVFTSLGAKLVKIPVDEYGMDVDQIENVLKTKKIKLLYVIPHHHHPTTVTMSTARRVRLVQLIRQYGLPVIEDDYDYDFHYQNSPVLPLASANHDGNVIYIGSFTKLLAPSFRVGYLIATPDFVEHATNLRLLMDLRGDNMMEDALAVFINKGDLARHIKKSVKIYNQRCELACKLLSEQLSHAADFTKPQGGMAIWLRFKENYPLDIILSKAAAKGLILAGSAHPLSETCKLNAIRFGFASLKEEQIYQVVNILREITT